MIMKKSKRKNCFPKQDQKLEEGLSGSRSRRAHTWSSAGGLRLHRPSATEPDEGGGGARVNKYSMCDMNMEEGKVYMSAPWSKLALSSLLKAENECAGSRVQPAADRAKCVMR